MTSAPTFRLMRPDRVRQQPSSPSSEIRGDSKSVDQDGASSHNASFLPCYLTRKRPAVSVKHERRRNIERRTLSLVLEPVRSRAGDYRPGEREETYVWLRSQLRQRFLRAPCFAACRAATSSAVMRRLATAGRLSRWWRLRQTLRLGRSRKPPLFFFFPRFSCRACEKRQRVCPRVCPNHVPSGQCSQRREAPFLLAVSVGGGGLKDRSTKALQIVLSRKYRAALYL